MKDSLKFESSLGTAIGTGTGELFVSNKHINRKFDIMSTHTKAGDDVDQYFNALMTGDGFAATSQYDTLASQAPPGLPPAALNVSAPWFVPTSVSPSIVTPPGFATIIPTTITASSDIVDNAAIDSGYDISHSRIMNAYAHTSVPPSLPTTASNSNIFNMAPLPPSISAVAATLIGQPSLKTDAVVVDEDALKKIWLKDWLPVTLEGFPSALIESFTSNLCDEGFVSVCDLVLAKKQDQLTSDYCKYLGFKLGHYNRLNAGLAKYFA